MIGVTYTVIYARTPNMLFPMYDTFNNKSTDDRVFVNRTIHSPFAIGIE
jgi:hypothetical protein